MTVTTLGWRAMGSEVNLVVVAGPRPSAATGAELAARARARLAELEARWSRFVPTSDIARLNAAGGRPLVVDPATVTLVTTMVEAWWVTGGRFDPTLLPRLVDLGYAASWDDPTAVSLVDAGARWRLTPEAVAVDAVARVVQLPVGVTLDAGGLGKGLAADLIATELLEAGAGGALVDVGGDLRVKGRAPQDGGWTIDVADPHRPGDVLARVALLDGGVATSGTTVHRWRTPAGVSVHHLLDPTTGRPTPHTGPDDVVAATVVAGTGAWAEALAKVAALDWPAAATRLDERGAGACVVTAAGERHTNVSWARYALEVTANDALEVG